MQLSGIIYATCTNQTYSVAAIDPMTGQPRGDRKYPLPPNASVGVHAGCKERNNLILRQKFDRRFSRLAVEIFDFPDGSQHAGFIHADSGKMIDITGLRQTTGFTEAPHHIQPLFNPADDSLVVLEADLRRASAATETKATVSVIDQDDGTTRPLPGGEHVRGVNRGDFYLLGPKNWVLMASSGTLYAIPNPSGTVATGGSYISFRDGKNMSLTGVPNCSPSSWVDERRFLCTVNTEVYLITLTNSDRAASRAEAVQVTPETDRTNSQAIASPDGNQIAFVSQQGSLTEIYRVDLRPGAQPERVATAPQGVALLEWR